MSFPPEIIEKFLSYLDLDESLSIQQKHANLRAYGLVSRTWCAFAQSRLFATVVIEPPNPDLQLNSTELLARTLSDSPHTCSYVKTLTLKVTSTNQDAAMIKIISNVPNLETLRMIHVGDGYGILLPDLFEALPKALSSTNLTSLGVAFFVDLPFSILTYSLTLEELFISHSSWVIPETVDGGTVVNPPSGPRPSPKVIILSGSLYRDTKILAAMLQPHGPFDLSKVKKFWAMDRSNSDAAYRLLCNFTSAISTTLEDVFIDLPTSSMMSSDSADFFPSEKLSSLRVARVAFLQSDFRGSNSVPWVISAIDRLPNPEKLERITLHCIFRDEASRSKEKLLSQGWGQLGAILALPRFRDLQVLEVACYQQEEEEKGMTLVKNLSETLGSISKITSTKEYNYVRSTEPGWLRE